MPESEINVIRRKNVKAPAAVLAAWVFAFVVVVYYAFILEHGSWLLRTLLACVVQMPLWPLMAFRSGAKTIASAAAYATVSLAPFVPLGIPMLVGMAFGFLLGSSSHILVAIIVPVALAIVAISGFRAVWKSVGRTVTIGLVLSVLAGGAYGGLMIWGVLYKNFVPRYGLSHEDAGRAMNEIVGCAWQYQHNHNSAPPDLKVLGRQGIGCLANDLAAGKRLNFRFRIVRNAEQWQLMASDRSLWEGKPVALETGMDAVIRDRQSGTIVHPYEGALEILSRLQCIRDYHQEHGNEHYPATLHSALSSTGYGCSAIGEKYLSEDELRLYTYSFRYRLTKKEDGQTGFAFVARPVGYGGDGVRSYYSDDSGTIRATADNREPTAYDPEIVKRELYHY